MADSTTTILILGIVAVIIFIAYRKGWLKKIGLNPPAGAGSGDLGGTAAGTDADKALTQFEDAIKKDCPSCAKDPSSDSCRACVFGK